MYELSKATELERTNPKLRGSDGSGWKASTFWKGGFWVDFFLNEWSESELWIWGGVVPDSSNSKGSLLLGVLLLGDGGQRAGIWWSAVAGGGVSSEEVCKVRGRKGYRGLCRWCEGPWGEFLCWTRSWDWCDVFSEVSGQLSSRHIMALGGWWRGDFKECCCNIPAGRFWRRE